MFYEFRQNNSRGRFEQDIKRGISQYVIIEADSAAEAVDRAERIGLYFNGCDEGMDCPCCGDRWYAPWDDKDGQPVPSHYGTPIMEYKDKWDMIWKEADHLFIHYKNGTIENFQKVTEEDGEGSYFKKLGATGSVPKFSKVASTKLVKKTAKKAAKKSAAKKSPVKKTVTKKKVAAKKTVTKKKAKIRK